MHLSTRRIGELEQPYISFSGPPVPVRSLVEDSPTGFQEILPLAMDPKWRQRAQRSYERRAAGPDSSTVVAPYRRPHKILGIGLNYRENADDLDADYPTSPASFLKADHTIIGPGDSIVLPVISERVTAEAEIGIVIGRLCYQVTPEDALDYVVGVVQVLDQTAEDILRENPRFLTRAKNFPTFFAFGPEITTLDDLPVESFSDLHIATYRNGRSVRENIVANMLFSPAHLVAFHSHVMPLYPGDIISTGTPGATEIHDGDVVECRIQGVSGLSAPVISAVRIEGPAALLAAQETSFKA